MDKIELANRFLEMSTNVDSCCHNHLEFRRRPYLQQQLLRSSSSALLNYGEAQYAQSKRDFIHKLRLSLKELSETVLGLKHMNKLFPDEVIFRGLVNECTILVKILYASIKKLESKQ